MFTVGGRNVYPAEIESALSAHSDVLSCLVVGVPDDDLGHVPYALVQAATSLTAEALHAFLAEQLSAYKVPRTIEFVDRAAARRRGQGAAIGRARRRHCATGPQRVICAR